MAEGYFNPRTPCGVRPGSKVNVTNHSKISIHAPRVGCDTLTHKTIIDKQYFNPRTPCGVRPLVTKMHLG